MSVSSATEGLDVSFMALALRSCMGAGNQAKHGENGHNGGGAIAEEGEGQTDNGHNTDAHAHIDHNLEHQRGTRTEANQTAHIVLTSDTYVEAPGNHSQFQAHNEDTSEESQFLTDGGEDVVRMLGIEVTALGTVTVEQTLSGQTAAGQGLQVDFGVITLVDTLGSMVGSKRMRIRFLW